MTQNLQALAVATEVRNATTVRRRYVKAARGVAPPWDTEAGMARLAEELDRGGRWPKRLTVAEILVWPCRTMPWQRQALLRHAGLSETRTVQTLTAREVGVLCHALRSPVVWRGRG